MNTGKSICNELKKVRRRIADENNIPLEIPECTYKGPCAGTCPRCEWELRQLETGLADRIRLGKVATVAGIALGLSLGANAQSEVPQIEIGTPTDSTHREVAKGCLKGTVIDAKTKEPLPFVNVVLMKDEKVVKGATTDFDGMFTIKPVPAGEYTIVISYVGYTRIVREGIRVKPTGFTMCDISLPPDTAAVLEYGVRERTATTIEDEPKIAIGGVQQVLLPGTPANTPEIPERIEKRNLLRGPTPGEVPAEIQVILDGTPASIGTPQDTPMFYEDKPVGPQVYVR